MENIEKLQKTMDELRRVTGLPLDIDVDDAEDSSFVQNQLQALLDAYKEKNNRNAIIKKWITGEITGHELYRTAKRFHLAMESPRSLFLIEAKEPFDSSVMTILSHAFPDSSNVWLVPMSPTRLAFIHAFPKQASEKKLLKTAYLIVDILNTEALIQVKLSYSHVISDLGELPVAYQETTLALQVGKIFYSGKNVYPHNQLGLGRLINDLPRETCVAYMRENFGDNYASYFHPETVHAINCFLNNNLNIAETARQMHMHRNTFIYRIEQIEKDTGLDIRRFHDAMTLKTALYVMNYLEATQE